MAQALKRVPPLITPAQTALTSPSAGKSAGNHPQIKIGLDQRWAVLGASETGKTTFAKELIGQYRRYFPHAPVYVLDTKGVDFGEWAGRIRAAEPPDAAALEDGWQVWEPPTVRVDAKLTDRWLDGILNAHGPAVVFIDELSNTTRVNRPDAYPAGLEVLQKTGRGLNKCMIVLTQAVAKGPGAVFGQSTHLVRFGLESEYDKRAANMLLGFTDKADHEPANMHGFYWCRLLSRPKQPHEYSGYKEFFGL